MQVKAEIDGRIAVPATKEVLCEEDLFWFGDCFQL